MRVPRRATFDLIRQPGGADMSQQNKESIPEESIPDWVAETDESIAARLEGVKSAQGQTRLTLGTMAVISVMMVIASYNAYLSYDYHWIVKQNCPPAVAKISSEAEPAQDTPAVREVKEKIKALTDHSIKEWASSRTVVVSLLGIRVSVDDVSVLGTAVLFVLSLWLFLVSRRENHTTGFLLRDTDSPRPEGRREPPGAGVAEGEPMTYSNEQRWLIYHTIISTSFFVIFDRLPNVDSLDGRNSLDAALKDNRPRLNRWALHVTRGFFFFFPAVVALSVFWLDFKSYDWKDPFEFGCEAEGREFFRMATVIFGACFVPLLMCCWKSSRLSNNTEKVLREYGVRLHDQLPKESQPPKS